MDQEPQTVDSDSRIVSVDESVLDAASLPFVGRWNQLVSRTKCEKGRIIYQWRESLIVSGAPATRYSDEAWSSRVGGVTGQHVGRLRRVYQRFGQVYEDYPGLYWSHFQAGIDWEDAEMWLEGAVQNTWSVSQMRNQRWDTMGSVGDERPDDTDIVANDLDEDFEPAVQEVPGSPDVRSSADVQIGACEESADFGDADQVRQNHSKTAAGAAVYADDLSESTVAFVRPFADLNDLPEDLAEAFETFKLAILNHKMNGWEEISREDVLSSLEALKQLILAPSFENASF